MLLSPLWLGTAHVVPLGLIAVRPVGNEPRPKLDDGGPHSPPKPYEDFRNNWRLGAHDGDSYYLL